MSDLGTQGGLASAHEAAPVMPERPSEVGTVEGPKGDVKFGDAPAGIGSTTPVAH